MDARTWSTAGSLHRTIAPSSSSSSSSQTNHRSAELCSDGDAVQRFTTAPTHKSPPAYGEGLSQYLLEVSERIGLSCSTDSNSVKEEAEEVRAPLKRLRRLYLGDAPCTPSSATTTVTTSTTTAAAAAASTTTCTSTAASISTTPDVALTTSSSATTTRPRLWLGPTSYAPEAKEEEDHHNTSSTATSPSIVSPAQPPTLRSIFLDADQATYEALCTVGLSTLMPAMASTTSTSLTVPSSGDVDARLDLLEEVKLCNIVPLLPRTFAWRSLVQQVVPCTAVGAPTTTTTTASSDASVCGGHCSGHVRAAQAAHREHLLHLSVLPSPGTSSTSTSTTGATTTTTTTNNNTGDEASVPPASAADIPPWERLWGSETRGVMVEWCSGGVGYTTDVDGLLEEQRRRAERTYYFPMTSYHARGHHHHQQQQQEVVGAKRPRSMMDLDLHQPPHTLRGATLLQLWSAKEFADEKMDLQHHNTRDASSSTMEMKTEEEKGSTYSTVLAAPQQHQHHHQICCGCHHCQPWSARYAHVALQCVDLQAYLHELHRVSSWPLDNNRPRARRWLDSDHQHHQHHYACPPHEVNMLHVFPRLLQRGDANTNTKYHEDDDDDDEVQWLGNIARRTRAVEVCALEECVLVCLAPENQPYRAELLPPMEAFIRLLSCRLAPRVEMAMEACADVRGTRLAEAVAEELHTTPESLHASTNFMMSEMNVSLPPHNPVAARRRYRQQMRASVQQHVVGGDGMSSTLHSCATRAWEHLCSSIPLLAHDDEEAKKERPTKVLLLDDDDDDGQDAGNEDEDENDLATRLAKMHADDALNSAAEEVVGVVVEALRHVLYRRIMVMYELLRWLATRFAMGRSNRELMLRYRQWYAETPSPAAVLRLLHKSACFQSAMVRRFPRYFSFLADEATTPPQSPMTPPSYTSSKHHHHHYHSRRGFASANTTSGELSDEMDHHAFVPESALLEECYWSRFAEWAARGSSTTHSPHHLALAPAPPPTMYASPLPHAAQLPSPTFSSASHRSPTLGGGDASPTSTDTSSPHSPASTTTPSSSAYATQHHSAAVDATLRVVMRSLQHDGRTMSLDEIDHHSRLPQRITE